MLHDSRWTMKNLKSHGYSRTLAVVESIVSARQAEIVQAMIEGSAAEPRKLLHFLVGAPGSGKSTVTGAHPDASILSTDDYPGLYTPGRSAKDLPAFNFKKLPEAHQWNQSRAAHAMAAGHPHVIIDNTNTAAWQLAPYLHHAAKHGYDVHVTHVTAPLEQIRARGKHFPREVPRAGTVDRLGAMKNEADGFAKKLHALKNHPAPMKELDREGAFHAPWEDSPEKRRDHSALHGLNYTIDTIDTSDRRHNR